MAEEKSGEASPHKKSDRPPATKRFPVGEKRRIVAEIESGVLSVDEAARKYCIADRRSLINWLTTFGTGNVGRHKGVQHSRSHRLSVALQIRTGALTVAEAARQNQVLPNTITKWLSDLSEVPPAATLPVPGDQMTGNKTKKHMGKETSQPPPAGTDTGQFIAALQLKIVALETMIDLAEEELQISIRKKCGTKQQ